MEELKRLVEKGKPVDREIHIHYQPEMVPFKGFLNDPRIKELIRQKVKEAVERARKPPVMPFPIPEITGRPQQYHAVVDETKVPAVAVLNQAGALTGIRDLLEKCQEAKIPGHPEFLCMDAAFVASVAVCIGLAATQLEKLLAVLEANDLAE